jgi:hypothetical protein
VLGTAFESTFPFALFGARPRRSDSGRPAFPRAEQEKGRPSGDGRPFRIGQLEYSTMAPSPVTTKASVTLSVNETAAMSWNGLT